MIDETMMSLSCRCSDHNFFAVSLSHGHMIYIICLYLLLGGLCLYILCHYQLDNLVYSHINSAVILPVCCIILLFMHLAVILLAFSTRQCLFCCTMNTKLNPERQCIRTSGYIGVQYVSGATETVSSVPLGSSQLMSTLQSLPGGSTLGLSPAGSPVKFSRQQSSTQPPGNLLATDTSDGQLNAVSSVPYAADEVRPKKKRRRRKKAEIAADNAAAAAAAAAGMPQEINSDLDLNSPMFMSQFSGELV